MSGLTEVDLRILSIAKQKGEFSVSLNYRDEKLRNRCGRLKRDGHLVGGRRRGRYFIFYPAARDTHSEARS